MALFLRLNLFFAGSFALIACIVFTVFNTVSFNFAFPTETSNIFGYSFYIAWASAALLVASGFMMMSSCKESNVNKVSLN